MTRTHCIFLLVTAAMGGCKASGPHLSFPEAPIERTREALAYDVDGDGTAEFHVRADDRGRFDVLTYDDDADGRDDRIYRLSQYDNARVPHLIILLDSIPYQPVLDRWREARWTWFDEPKKVIPPFPTMSGIIFSRLLHTPPLGGMINQYYDSSRGRFINRISQRAGGSMNPWEQRLDYRLKYWENGLSFLEPRSWFHVELARAKQAFDASPDRVTVVYFASTAGMLSKYSSAGLDEVLDGLEQLCMSILHERCGAVKISITADHGHRLRDGERIDLEQMLKDAGFHPTSHLRTKRDVAIELDGLVNYAGIHTTDAAGVAQALVAHREIQLAVYLQGERVIVQSAAGRAAITRRGQQWRYEPIDADVLDYQSVIDSLRRAGLIDEDGYGGDQDWFDSTVDHQWPDAPARLWDAFHGLAVNTPDVMITTAPGYFVGLASMEWFIHMASTHGGLDQPDSATFVMTMTGRTSGPLRTGDVLNTVEPEFDFDRKPR